jgi:GAF domain-containing protein/anti-sigma regulatory factor (Ser/Thr protein kinase)
MPSETSRACADQSVEELTAALAKAQAERDEAHRREAATAEVLRVISKCTTDVQPVFDAIVVSSKSLLRAHSAAAILIVGRELVLAAYTPTNLTADDELERMFPRPLDGTIIASVVRKGAPHVVSDTEANDSVPLYLREVARQHGYRSALFVPMLSMGNAIGAIVVSRATSGAFSDKDIALLQTFADQAVIAIENVRLFNETKEALEQQKASADVLAVISSSIADAQPVFDRIVASCERLFAGKLVGINLVDDDGMIRVGSYHGRGREQFERVFPIPLSRESGSGRAILERRVLHYPDVMNGPDVPDGVKRGCATTGIKACILAPLLWEGQGLGAIFVGRDHVGGFSEKDIALLKTFADQAVIAIENTRLFEAEQASKRELQESLEYQIATSDVLNVISRSPTELQPVLDAIAATAARLCESKDALVWRVAGGRIRVVAEFGSPTPASTLPLTRGSVTGRAIVDRKTIHVHDLAAMVETEYPDVKERQQRVGHRTALVAPLLSQGQALGAISVRKAHVRPFSDRQIALLQTFADQAVIAIENTRLFEEVQARTRELTDRTKELTETLEYQTATSEVLGVISRSTFTLQPVLEAVVESATRLCGAKRGHIFRFDGEVLRFAAAYGAWPGFTKYLESHSIRPGRGGASERAALEGRTVHITDVLLDSDYERLDLVNEQGYRTVLAVPMLREGTLLGVIAILKTHVDPFTDKQIALVETFADQAVIAIENVRLLNELRESLQQQTATADVLKVISRSAFDLQAVLDTLAASAARLCDSDQVAIHRREGDVYPWSAISGLSGDTVALLKEYMSTQPLLPGRASVIGRAVLECRSVQVPDVCADPEYTLTEAQRLAGYRTAMGVPLLREGVPIGAMALLRTRVTAFSDKEIELAQTFADQAVIAIENTRLFEEVQERTRELQEALEQQTATADVLKVISRSALDVQRVLDALVESAARLCNAYDAAIFQVFGDGLRLVAHHGQIPLEGPVGQFTIPLVRGFMTGRAVLDRRTIQVVDILAEGDEYPESRRFALQIGWRTTLAVPLVHAGEAIGAIFIRRAEVRPFTERQIELVNTFADQAVIAIENSRLFEEVQARTSELAQTVEDLEIASQHKSQFVANMSHELRTPLAAILGYAELIQEGFYGPQPDKSMDALTRIRSNGKHLLGLINTVLDIAKIESGQFTLNMAEYAIESVVETVRSATESLAQNKKLALKTVVAKSLPIGLGDEQRLTQVLLNLVGNAIKFTDTGEVRVTAKAVNGHFNISVTDTGPGIPEEHQARIFEQFHQVDSSNTKAKGGTGLGLAIAKQIVEMHGGRIWVESTLGEGSTFQMELPTRAELRKPASATVSSKV